MKEKIPMKQWLPLIGLTLSAFIFNTSEFMPIGLLTDIAADFKITEAQAGIMITVYAYVVMLMSLPLMIAASRLEFRKLLLGTVTLFAVSHVVSGIATSYGMLMASRIGVACAHAIFWSIAAPLGVRIVSEAHRSLALGMVATGTSIAIIFGLPIGRVIGLALGWRMTFMSVAVAAFLILAYLTFVFPKVPSDKPFSVKELPELLRNKMLLGVFFMAFIIPTAYYTAYSYIEPFLLQVAHMPESLITWTLVLFGGFGMLGSVLFSMFFNRAPYFFLKAATGGVAAALLFLNLAANSSHATVIALCAFWGITVTAFNISMNAEIISCAPKNAVPVAMSIFSGIYNLGIGSGTFFGGLVCTYATIADIGYAGGAVGIVATLFCSFYLVRQLRKHGK